MTSSRLPFGGIAAALALFAATPALVHAAPGYQQDNLVSNVPGLATFTDANLRNPWGIAYAPKSPFWVSNQASQNTTLYNGAGLPQALVVSIPSISPTPPLGPTGAVFNNTTDFALSVGGKSLFLFANLDGSIAGWNGAVGTTARITVLPSRTTSYTGLALGNNGSGNLLYAADSRNNRIDVFDGAFAPQALPGTFTDPNLPAGFSVYNIQQIGGKLLVSYESEGAGGGVVDAFDFNGTFLQRITANAAGGPLDSPWGMALAPSSFGKFGGALLVGSEGNGRISAFNSSTGAFLGQLEDVKGNPIVNDGLWGLTFGNGSNGGSASKLYFAAGINGETGGLFGSISAVPEPSTLLLFGVGGLVVMASGWSRRRRA